MTRCRGVNRKQASAKSGIGNFGSNTTEKFEISNFCVVFEPNFTLRKSVFALEIDKRIKKFKKKYLETAMLVTSCH